MAIDFFVHPSYELANREDAPAREYKDAAAQAFLDSAFPVLITNKFGHDEPMLSMFSQRNVLYDASWSDAQSKPVMGYVGLDSWKRLTEIVDEHEGEEMKIHGASFGWPAMDFAFQLLAYAKEGIHMHCWEDPNDSTEADRDWLAVVSEYYVEKGMIQGSKIRYGHVLADPGSPVVRAPPSGRLAWLKKIFTFTPFGDLNYQLIDDKTTIHGDITIK